jgi:hypothetical protein
VWKYAASTSCSSASSASASALSPCRTIRSLPRARSEERRSATDCRRKRVRWPPVFSYRKERLPPNSALLDAADADELLPVYVFDPHWFGTAEFGALFDRLALGVVFPVEEVPVQRVERAGRLAQHPDSHGDGRWSARHGDRAGLEG